MEISNQQKDDKLLHQTILTTFKNRLTPVAFIAILGILMLLAFGIGVLLSATIQNNLLKKKGIKEPIDIIDQTDTFIPSQSEPTEIPLHLTPQPETIVNPVKGKIAFVTEGEIWLINADRTGLMQITSDEFNKFGINISPDGKKIAYSIYPKDEKKRTNQGFYVGFNSGLAAVEVDSRQIKILVPYGSLQHHYPVWSFDNQYVSIWLGNGTGAKVFEVASGQEMLSLVPSKDSFVSPVTWIPQSEKISFIFEGDLIKSNRNGSNREVLATGADALRFVHEGPNVPEPPLWSKSGRYVTFYKNGDLHIMDAFNRTDVLVERGKKEGLFNQYYPQAYVLGYISDETKLYLLDYSRSKNSVVLDLPSGKLEEIASLGQGATVSPDSTKLIGRNEETTNNTITILDTTGNKTKECPGTFRYSYYTWAGGTTFSFNQAVWSPDSIGLLGYNDYGRNGLQILNTDTCEVYDLLVGKEVSESAVWFPHL